MPIFIPNSGPAHNRVTKSTRTATQQIIFEGQHPASAPPTLALSFRSMWPLAVKEIASSPGRPP